LTSALKSAAKGDFTARAEVDRLEGESAEVALLLNQVLEQVSIKNSEFEARKQQTVQVVDQALDALIALVRQGELNRWTASNTTDDPLLGPLLEGFGKVIETLRTFVREINEAALTLSSSANEVLAPPTPPESSSTKQAAAIHETTATMEELKHASAQIAENAGAVVSVAVDYL